MQWAARTTNVKLPSENQSTFETTDSEKKSIYTASKHWIRDFIVRYIF